ncbi:hypothetical protein C0431_10380 [bacterium]|jgi:hypothetical protein|nr:hypothetical protein [bacterium]
MTCDEALANFEKRVADQIERMRKATDGLTDGQLRAQPEPGVWGVGQVIEHLNLATGPYLTVMDRAIRDASGDGTGLLKLTFLGRLIAKAAGPDGNAPAPKAMSPEANQTSEDVAEWFRQADRVLELLLAARGKNLVRTKFKNPFLSVISMNLCDGFTIIVEHNERHIRQIEERLPKVVGV